MTALEIWTNANGGVMLRDPTTGACRELKDVRWVAFADGSTFPSPKNHDVLDTQAVRTLGGQPLKVRNGP